MKEKKTVNISELKNWQQCQHCQLCVLVKNSNDQSGCVRGCTAVANSFPHADNFDKRVRLPEKVVSGEGLLETLTF